MSEPLRATGPATTRWDWTLLLPPGWIHLPTGVAEGRRAVKALLDRRLRHLPRDEIARGRRVLERELRAALSDARQAGAGDVWTQVDLAGTLELAPTEPGSPARAPLSPSRPPRGRGAG